MVLDRHTKTHFEKNPFAYVCIPAVSRNLHPKLLVVEEGEPYLQEAVRSCAQGAGLMLSIQGKGKGLFSRLYELDPSIVKNVIASFFQQPFTPAVPVQTNDLPEAPARPPNLCPGCPHRATYVAVREVFGDNAIYPTDIGCYTLGLLPPLNMGDFLIAMGAGVGTAGGFARATGHKVVAFIGDSTFFHSGLSPLASAVYNQHEFLLVVLDNGTTGMTGHQPHPGVDLGHLNLSRKPISIEAVVKGLGVENVVTVNPFHYRKTVEAVRGLADCRGVSVLIARAPCPLYERTLPGFRQRRPLHVKPERCRNHQVCTAKLACPAFFESKGRI